MMTENESPLLNITDTVSWRDRWWLLDVETSGLDRQEDDIIALRLACMENYTRPLAKIKKCGKISA